MTKEKNTPQMRSYTNKYMAFTWMRIQTAAGLTAAGMLFSLLLRVCARRRLRDFTDEYDAYVRRAGISAGKEIRYAYLACLLIYGSHVKEFFLYDFLHLNDKGRREFITEISRYRLYPIYNGAKKRPEMQDKMRAFEAFRQYYHREVMRIEADTSEEAVRDLLKGREGGILKPNFAGCGRGVEIVRLADFPSESEAFAYILSKHGYVLEQLVTQTGLMRSLHPQSVNTVRVYACRAEDGIRIFGSHLRIGVGDSVVDNAAQGGVVVSITNDGWSWRSGVDEFGKTYLVHPDTQVPLAGLQMPEWDKARALVREAMDVFPDIRFVGWDLAYTADGWIIIEANDNAQFYGAQMPYHRGAKPELLRCFQRGSGEVL